MKVWENRPPFNVKRITRQILLSITDAAIFILSCVVSLWIRFEFNFDKMFASDFFSNLIRLLPITTIAALLIFAISGLYNSLWDFASEREMFKIGISAFAASVTQTLIHYIMGLYVPKSFVLIHFLLLFIMISFSRFSYKFFRHQHHYFEKRKSESKRTMIIGAGNAGATVIRELQQSKHVQNKAVCIIDDDPKKLGNYMYDVPVVGGREKILQAARDYEIEEIIFAIPVASVKQRSEILNICKNTGCKLRTLPGIYQLVNDEVSLQKIREVKIEDLLSRESVKVNINEIVGYVNDRTVLVTGGGGSIGSELCRQIAEHGPRKLVIFDIYENNAYSIQQELLRKFPNLDLVVLIGSVRDEDRVDIIFNTYRPNIVFHAAAHKHVPLMETSPNESIKNNVFGTRNVARAADRYGADTFILISTDKAVNPTNIMGASKRICEMIVCHFAQASKTKFACVRFGNVLGSNGSVIPLFKKQIEHGGPVTVTHKGIVRYFMTIPEAVSLVLQAGSYAKNGEIFVLDMGDPVKIDDLARNMIRLSGFEPDVDIAIEYTGLRPGEKLYEELLLSEEGLEKTPNDLIFIGHLEPIDSTLFRHKLSVLSEACSNNSPDIRDLVKDLVPEYNPESH